MLSTSAEMRIYENERDTFFRRKQLCTQRWLGRVLYISFLHQPYQCKEEVNRLCGGVN